jgi:hypothetical protein
VSADTAEAVRRIVEAGGDADDVLRACVTCLADEPDVSWAGVALAEDGALQLGPSLGAPDPGHRRRVPILFQSEAVGELWVDGTIDRATLDRVAALIAPFVLIGWDTGGEDWDP